MLYLLQQIDLLKDLPFGEVILHVALLDGLNGHVLAGELVDAEGDLAERAFADELHELVVLEGGGRQLVVLLDIGFDELYQSVALLKNGLIDFCSIIHARITGYLHVTRIGVTVSNDASGYAPSQSIATAKMSKTISNSHIQSDTSSTSTYHASSLIYYIIMGMTRT